MHKSRPQPARDLPIDNQEFPGMTTAAVISDRISETLRREYAPYRYAEKLLARKVHASPRAVRNWFSGICAPRAAELVRLMAESEELEREVARLIQELRETRS